MTIDNQDIERRIAVLQKAYFDSLPNRLAEISEFWRQVKTSTSIKPLEALRHAIHSLAGSGATFGLDYISTIARKFENELNLILEDSRTATPQETASLTELFESLAQQVATSQMGEDVTELLVPVVSDEKQVIYVVEDDEFSADRLGIELLRERYEVEVFHSLDDFTEAFHQQIPAGIIMDIVFPENNNGGLEVIDQLRKLYDPMPPVIYISVRSDIQARLAAVQNGATRYITKPFDYRRLAATMDGLTKRVPQNPYRVMVIDDDELLAEYYATLLRGAGMEIRIVNEPMQVLLHLAEFTPDLILMDIYMPDCSGLELAAVIRQDDDFVSLPIVYLSTEADTDKQLYAMDLGGDDFLTKPVKPVHLINAVSVRVKRARRLARLNKDLELALIQNRHQHKELEKKEQRLRYSQQFANIGTWDLEVGSGKMFWSEPIAHLLGVSGNTPENEAACYATFLDAIHPEDRQNISQAISDCIAGRRQFEIEHRAIREDGSIHWLLQRGDVVRDAHGQPERMLGVVIETTQRKKLERDLATQKDLAVQASRAKSDFLSRMSHELRTPLNAIIGFTQLLQSDSGEPVTASQQDSLDEILRAGNHLLELIDEVLDLARIEAGKMKLKLEELALDEILLECFSLMLPLAEASGIKLDFSIDDCAEVRVRADRTRLRQVMLNLLSNAIKYNGQNGSVRIHCDAFSLSRIRINVIDTGPGIPADRQSELFQAFSRLGAESTEVEGTGIGLMITRRLAEMMGGELGFSSQINEGSTFWIELARTDISGEVRQEESGLISYKRLTGTEPKKNN